LFVQVTEIFNMMLDQVTLQQFNSKHRYTIGVEWRKPPTKLPEKWRRWWSHSDVMGRWWCHMSIFVTIASRQKEISQNRQAQSFYKPPAHLTRRVDDKMDTDFAHLT